MALWFNWKSEWEVEAHYKKLVLKPVLLNKNKLHSLSVTVTSRNQNIPEGKGHLLSDQFEESVHAVSFCFKYRSKKDKRQHPLHLLGGERERERNSTKYYSHTYNYHLLLDLLQLLKSEELSHFQQSQRNGGAKILACLPAVAKIGDLLSRASWKPGSCLMDMCLVCL